MKKFLLGSNWKMNKTTAEGLAYASELMATIKNYPQIDFFIIPPFTHLWKMKELMISENTALKLGAQNMHYEDFGQFTGQISPVMLKEIGIDIVLLGHNDCRQHLYETDESVNLKTLAALKFGFTPLICIGEKREDKNYGVSKEMLAKQLKIALKNVPSDAIGKFWVAYEPVWAIGDSGTPPEASYVEEIHNHLRNIVIELYGELGADIPLLYGGSVNIDNAKPYALLENVDGLFFTRSAWPVSRFEAIMAAVTEILN
ncbi:triose-phosphate isomerase family protein [Acetobacterium tundrae]|uniref:Triosephosphate isomerase n=1 Tax=Acetobacterium tundrae TaxID=132932 RepID=A0ABR6WQ38_9FIRM|nr:triose-phosphate isomerase [Acetobacterium tundrae]MBC3798265.1 triose-phosphate isomerase [Acetobacterium tundrae]